MTPKAILARFRPAVEDDVAIARPDRNVAFSVGNGSAACAGVVEVLR
jgi:hypothetical protein